MSHDQSNRSAAKFPPGIWPSGKSFGARIRVGTRTAYLGRFKSVEDASLRIQLAESLRDARAAKGEPLTQAELQGRPPEGPDLFGPEDPQVRQARREARAERQARSWMAAHPEVLRELAAKLSRPAAKLAA